MKEKLNEEYIDIKEVISDSVVVYLVKTTLNILGSKWYIFILLFFIGGSISYFLFHDEKEVYMVQLVLQTELTNIHANTTILKDLKSIFDDEITEVKRIGNYDWFYDVYPDKAYPQSFKDWVKYQNVGTYQIQSTNPKFLDNLKNEILNLFENNPQLSNLIEKNKKLNIKKIQFYNNKIDSLVSKIDSVDTQLIYKYNERLVELKYKLAENKNILLYYQTKAILVHNNLRKSIIELGLVFSLLGFVVLASRKHFNDGK